MPTLEVFSPAQLTGYVAFAVGIAAFLQRDDRRLRAMVGVQAFSYALHFYLLGSMPAVAASLVTSARAFISLRTRSRAVAVLLIAVNLALGALTARSATSALPIAATTLGTIAFFWFDGIGLRLVLLGATGCWLLNNVLVGSIGGTLLELFIGASNAVTVYRLGRAGREGPPGMPRDPRARLKQQVPASFEPASAGGEREIQPVTPRDPGVRFKQQVPASPVRRVGDDRRGARRSVPPRP